MFQCAHALQVAGKTREQLHEAGSSVKHSIQDTVHSLEGYAKEAATKAMHESERVSDE